MNFVRPEARAFLRRWREVLAGEAVFLLGLYWTLWGGGILTWLGGVLMMGGLALTVVGVQRARFRGGGGGPGVVQVDEGRITYFGPLTGGAAAARELDRLTLDRSAHPAHWLLAQPGQPPLAIPVNAEGAEALFDVFASLPGIDTSRMLHHLNAPGSDAVVIWQRDRTAPALGDPG